MGYNKERYRTLKNMAYFLSLGVWYLFSLLPFWVHYLFSDLIYLLLYHVIGYRKAVVRKNLHDSFPEKSEEELMKLEHDFYHYFCDLMVESIKLMTISRKELRKRMVFKGTDITDQITREGQSCIAYMGHLGSWEWVTSVPLWLPSDVQSGQIYHPMENYVFDCLLLRLRQRLGSVSISMSDVLRKMVEFKRSGKKVVVGFISDQKPFWTNIHHWVNFLNHDTPVLTGTERIARMMDYAVLFLDIRRVKRGYYEAEIKLITRHPKELEEYALTDIYFEMLEQSIRRAPELWLWSHDRWSRTREEFNEHYEVVNGKVIRKK